QHKLNNLFLDGTPDPSRAADLAKYSTELGRSFDARAWAFLAKAMNSAPGRVDSPRHRSSGRSSLVNDHRAKAAAISSPYTTLPVRGAPHPPTLGNLLAGAGAAERAPASNAPEIGRAAGHSSRVIPRFVDDATTSGLQFTFDNGRTPQRMLPETLSGGVG